MSIATKTPKILHTGFPVSRKMCFWHMLHMHHNVIQKEEILGSFIGSVCLATGEQCHERLQMRAWQEVLHRAP